MAAAFSYTHYACPCSDLTSPEASASSPSTIESSAERTFNPHDPRADYRLYPLDQLLFCNECDAIRCARCYAEEIINWYCPNCLFEVASSVVKSDGNRCSRNCCNCPCCSSPLAVTTVPHATEEHLQPNDATNESYMLQCLYCDWSSLDINVHLNKPTKITEQLVKQRKAQSAGGKQNLSDDYRVDHDGGFEHLASFYKEQLSQTSDPRNPYGNSAYNSPANLARIMSLYGGLSVDALKKSREKPRPMREARDESEGLSAYGTSSEQDNQLQHQMKTLGWDDTTTSEQRLSAPTNHDAKFADQLWPVATPLRTRAGKRCKTCRQFLSRPDPKLGNMRYRIRLTALHHVPRLSLRPLQPSTPTSHPSFRLRNDDPTQSLLRPLSAQQYVLTIRNPIFEPIKVTLATPATTPGKVASRVTVLCPSFTVGPAGDVWDEALSSATSTDKDGGRKAAMASLTGHNSADHQPEAGKIWERTRSSTSVIVEIVPGQLKPPPSIVPKTEQELADEELDEDDDVLEVPVYVRVEWDVAAEEGDSEVGKERKKVGDRVGKELAYWCVLGVGQIGE